MPTKIMITKPTARTTSVGSSAGGCCANKSRDCRQPATSNPLQFLLCPFYSEPYFWGFAPSRAVGLLFSLFHTGRSTHRLVVWGNSVGRGINPSKHDTTRCVDSLPSTRWVRNVSRLSFLTWNWGFTRFSFSGTPLASRGSGLLMIHTVDSTVSVSVQQLHFSRRFGSTFAMSPYGKRFPAMVDWFVEGGF